MKESTSNDFEKRPHRTFLALSFPVLLSLIAEPLTGLVDTMFVARLGASPLAALGIGTVLLSSIYWIFNFLGISTQTSVARLTGKTDDTGVGSLVSLGLLFALVLGTVGAIAGWFAFPRVVELMGGEGQVREQALLYINIRLIGSPAILLTTVVFGAFRGLRRMRVPLAIAILINVVNIILDALLIPVVGIVGAAGATAASQWLGAIVSLIVLRKNIRVPERMQWADARSLLVIGGDMFVRTGMLTLFLLLATRSANRLGVEAGAAHQSIRQVWFFTALVLDAYAAAAQSLIGYYLGAERVEWARRVAKTACVWGIATGSILAAGMVALTRPASIALLPETARAVFPLAWFLSAMAQPMNALSFVTDGIHMGTGDYRFLRNGMIVATGASALLLSLIDRSPAGTLAAIWLVTAIWIAMRTIWGMTRIWPGWGNAPLRPPK